ncbi:MAG: hypothetical protein KDC76_08650 [Bacteroidetes bacterium]|nr:hypothetical protein [Bacteroidota bacterium]
MQIPVIKQLSEEFTTDQLVAAEEAILNETQPEIEIPGIDEGEQLTHVLAAIFIQNDMKDGPHDFRQALRNYSQKVRNSIS